MALKSGADLSFSFLSAEFDRMATREFLNFFKSRNFDYALIMKLETKMRACSSIVDDAKKKQFANGGVRKWLLDLKDATCEAEDVLNKIHIEYQAHQSKAIKEHQEMSFSSQDPLKQEIEPKLLEIIEKLEYLMQESEALRLSKAKLEEISEENWQLTSSNSFGNLQHLSHLDLSYTSIRLLPEAVTNLINLEILILRGCWALDKLPADMARLINLSQLDLREAKRLRWMPPGMGKLKKLSMLSDAVVGENGGSSIKGDWNASEAIFQDKKDLKMLKLSWNNDPDYSRQVQKVLKRLQSQRSIESIMIRDYGGIEFPSWVGDISFSNLKKLCLNLHKNCIYLHSLWQLASLEELSIDGGYDGVLKAIGGEFYGIWEPGEMPFSSLKRLKFNGMLKWREWSSCNEAFAVLEELWLCACPELMSVPSHLPSLKRLSIRGCGELDIENLLISTCATLETVSISGSEKVKYISVENFPNLKVLEIWNCSNVESLGSAAAATTITRSYPLLVSSPSLASLHIAGCSKLVSLPRGGLHAPNLMKIQLHDCCNLKSLPQGMHFLLPSLQKLVISGCPEIESFPDGGLPSKLQSLEIKSCEKLLRGRMQWGLQSLPSLSNMLIGGGSFEDVESSFPEETLLPSSLQSLGIRCFAKMKSLNYKGLQHLSSLQSLRIEGCENLECLPEEGLPSSLSSLHILRCPLLKKRCERKIGVDWPKIMHIPRLFIPKITNS